MHPEQHDWARSLDGLHDQVWKRLARGVADRRAPGRHPTLATVDAQGMPQARTVVLRAADREAATLRVYTDRTADKVEEVRNTPWAAIHIWDNVAHLQMRLSATVTILTGEPVLPVWSQLSDHARRCYGFQPGSGAPLADGLDYDRWPDPGAFAILQLQLEQIEALHLGHHHRRARFRRDDQWGGQWLVP